MATKTVPPDVVTQHTVDGAVSSMPSKKITAGSISSLVVVIVWYVLNEYVFHNALPQPVADAISGLLGIAVFGGVAYLIPPAANEGVMNYVVPTQVIKPPVAAALVAAPEVKR